MITNPTPYALDTEEGEALWWSTALLTVKATAEQTGGEFFLIEEYVPKGTAPPLHVHPDDDETFYVVEGEMTFYLGDGQRVPSQTVPASAGTFLHIPKGYFPARLPGEFGDGAVSRPYDAPARTILPCFRRTGAITNPTAAGSARHGEDSSRGGRVRGRDTGPCAGRPTPSLTHKHRPGRMQVFEKRLPPAVRQIAIIRGAVPTRAKLAA